MENKGQHTTSKLQRNRAYIVLRYARSYVHHSDFNMGFIQQHGVYMDFEDAVRELKKVRLTQFEGYLAVASPELRDKHPFRNKIGALHENGVLIGRGYSWVDIYPAVCETVVRWMWIEKTSVYRRRGERGKGDELSAEQLQVLDAEGCIDYVTDRQRTPVLPENAIFDEATQDFVFDDEGDGDRGDIRSEARVRHDGYDG